MPSRRQPGALDDDVAVEDASQDAYAISGQHAAFYTVYWSPQRGGAVLAPPPAAGSLGQRFLHHWD